MCITKGEIMTTQYEFRKLDNTYVVRLNKEAEIISAIKDFCSSNNVKVGTIQGIGAINSVTFGFFNPETKQYNEKIFEGPREITSLIGNISTKNGETYLHLHMTASGEDYNTIGGHLINATISLTGEIFITPINGTVEREFCEKTGLNLLSFQ